MQADATPETCPSDISPEASAETSKESGPVKPVFLRFGPLFDLLAVLLLMTVAVPVRWHNARGDFWLDEADYATAAIRGYQANRWDLPEPSSSDKIVRLRHYHPPLIAHVMGLAMRWSPQDRILRVPSILAGAITVALVYLCGLYLFAPRGDPSRAWDVWSPRLIALACAAILIPTPAHVRASSHALPWSFITLWLVAVALCLAAYGRTRRPGWLAALGAALGLLFATSEYVVVASLGVGLALPVLLWRDVRDSKRRKEIAVGSGAGIVVMLLIAFVLWPAGLAGGLPRMLSHYVEMANDSWPVVISGKTFDRAPKWAYLYWYRSFYPAYAGWYALGAIGIVALAASLRLNVGRLSVVILTGVVLLAAHKSHIIGPEYLVHALPLLTLTGGLFFAAASELYRPLGAAAALLGAIAVVRGPVNATLAGMYNRDQISRWPAAAEFLKQRWTADTRMLAPAYGGVGRWYVMYGAGLRREEWRVQSLPASGARLALLEELRQGVYQFVAVGSTFSDWAEVDPKVGHITSAWPVVWRSDEHGTGASRLVVYQLPRGVDRSHPLHAP